MKLRYIYSGCVAIETNTTRIICDPWFTQGAYYGSWYIYPYPSEDPVFLLQEADAIYISHIHPDHYDKLFLQKYLKAFPRTRILIADAKPPILKRRMLEDGFQPEVVSETKVGDIEVALFFSAAHGELLDIDSAAAFRSGDEIIVNMNDNSYDQDQVARILDWCRGISTSLALLPYAGASAFPQMYFYEDKSKQDEIIDKLNTMQLALFSRYVEAFKPRNILPFAGKYWLGGALEEFNQQRAYIDAVQAAALFPDRAFVLADGGNATFDCATGQASHVRDRAYSYESVSAFLKSQPDHGFQYELDIKIPATSLPLVSLAKAALKFAIERDRVPLREDTWLCIKPHVFGKFICFNPKKADGIVKVYEDVEDLLPREEIFLDDRLLFGLFTHVYHWDNAYIGSHYRVRRTPDVYHPDLIRWLNFLHV